MVDADALTLLAKEPAASDNWVLTPHPGEAARLLDVLTDDIQNDRFTSAERIQQQYKGVCVLKGAGTIVASDNDVPGLCDTGNPGMASGGMGDVLTGIIASLIAQRVASGIALNDAAESVVKKGFPVPAPKITTRPFSR